MENENEPPLDERPKASLIGEVAHSRTKRLQKLVVDYLATDPKTAPFYVHPLNLQGVANAIEARQQSAPVDRQLLVNVLTKRYQDVVLSETQARNLAWLAQENTLTITTAHQPNLFTGPLYFVYKILHAVKLARELSEVFGDFRFVPVYYMGSEDADLDEIGQVTVDGKVFKWATDQTGAVGRMKVDNGLVEIVRAIGRRIGVEPFGDRLTALLLDAYQIGATISEATFRLVNALFAEYGLLVLGPDDAALKRAFLDLAEKELREKFSSKAVATVLENLSRHYKPQAGGREINLFYLEGDQRRRILTAGDGFQIDGEDRVRGLAELVSAFKADPGRVSPNVILRGLFQETVLPNIVYIGGGGELSYWLELLEVFRAARTPFPMLVLRNSFLLLDPKQQRKMEKLGLTAADLFLDKHRLDEKFTKANATVPVSLDVEANSLATLYDRIISAAKRTDVTLEQHARVLAKKALGDLNGLEKKMVRKGKRQLGDQIATLRSLVSELFPNGGLQERQENFSLFFAKQGPAFFEGILDQAGGLANGFKVLKN